jgi:hypothetical protein
MIENKEALRRCKGMQMRGDYPPRHRPSDTLYARAISRTETVDNFVINWLQNTAQPACSGPPIGSNEF